MTCDVQILRDFDVFATRDTFELNRSCNEFAQPFEQFCLVPPPSRLAATQTCRPFLNNVLDPSYIFPKTTQGLVVSLEDLPIMFVSFPEADSKDVWLRDETTSPNEILDFDTMKYRGFRPVSQASFVVSAAASAVQNQVFCLLSNSANSVDTFELYRADKFGMFRSQKDTQGNSIRMRYSSISIQGMPMVACNDDGTIQCACVANFAYVFDAQSDAWTRLSQTQVVTLTVFQNTVAFFLQTKVVFYLPRQVDIELSGVFNWQCLSLDRRFLFVGTRLGLQQVRIFTFDLSTQSLLAIATCSVTVALDTQVFFSAIATDGTPTSATVLVARGSSQSVVRFVLSDSFQNATQDLPVPLRFVDNFYNNMCWFENEKVHLVTNQGGVPKPQGMTTMNCLIPSSDSVWSFVNGKLMRLQAANWTNDFNLFMDYDARMNDENGPWYFPSSIDPPWYYGYTSHEVPNDSTTLPVFLSQSRHNRFRWIADSVETTNNTQFSHVVSHLERINDFFLITNGQSQLAEDGNVSVFQKNIAVFESNTHDQSSNPNSFVSLEPLAKRVVCTQNGLYLAYVNTQNDARHVVVCYNVFNSSQFADWCANESDEFVSRALQQQSTFCFQNLTYEEDQTGKTQFADNRCECLPSTAMFRLRFPDAFANVDSHIATRTIQNIPCLSSACSKVFLLGQENSNVLNYAQSQCKQNLVIGNQDLTIKGQVKMDFFNVNQDCGTGNRCTNNAQCPADCLCFQGNCIAKCTSDEYCKNNLQDPLASCQTTSGKCLYGLREPQPTNAKTYWITAGAVAIVVALILLVILLSILF